MRITYIQQHFRFPEEPGGSRPWEFARRLAASGHRVTLLVGGPRKEVIYREGVQVIRIKAPYLNSMGTARRILSFLSFMIRATSRAACTRADVVFASSTPLTTAVPGMLAAALQRSRFVFEVRDLWPSVPIELGALKNPMLISLSRTLERVAYRRADHIIALSPGMAKGILERRADASVSVIPNASDFHMFDIASGVRRRVRRETGWNDDLILFYAGSLGRSYDLPWLARLAVALKSHPIQVVICGNGAVMPELKQILRTAGIAPESVLWGSVPKERVAELLPSADFAVSTLIDARALEVNSLNKVFDALAAGKPVLFNHSGWLSELLCNHHAGWRLDRDPSVAARQLLDIVRDRSAIMRGGNASYSLGRAHFDRGRLFKAFEEVLTGGREV